MIFIPLNSCFSIERQASEVSVYFEFDFSHALCMNGIVVGVLGSYRGFAGKFDPHQMGPLLGPKTIKKSNCFLKSQKP